MSRMEQPYGKCGYKKGCCVSLHNIKSMMEMSGDVITVHEDSWTGLLLLCKMERKATGVNVSDQGVRNTLHEGGMRDWRPRVGPVCSQPSTT